MSTAIALVVAVGVASCGSENEGGPPKVLDENTASFEGVAVGGKVPANLDELLGRPCELETSIQPCESGSVDVIHSFPAEWGIDDRDTVTLLRVRDEVKAIVVTDEAAVTRRGVGIGDELSDAEERYPKASCGVTRFESSEGDPYCVTILPAGNKLKFSGDPINSIAIGRPAFG